MADTVTRGILYGVSVGPGDPQLMTLAAVQALQHCTVIAAPCTSDGHMLALSIAKRAVDLSDKIIVPLAFSMSRDKSTLHNTHKAAVEQLCRYLSSGQDTAYLSLGDISVYSTFSYIQELLHKEGYSTKMIPGVTSFCACAARLNRPLTAEMDEPLTIVPGHVAESFLAAPGSKVFMKSGRDLPRVLNTLQTHGLLKDSAMVCSCGLENEKIYPDLSAAKLPQEADYFSTILVHL